MEEKSKLAALRVVFMGTPDFAVSSLAILLEHDISVVGVITAVDRPAGRGQKLRQSAVKKFAVEKGLPVLQPENLKSLDFLEDLSALQPNLCIVVAFRMLPKVVWQMPAYGTFNLHASLLPNYRGAAPINWAVMNGETVTGVTTFFIDEKIDTGAVLLQKKTDITAEESAGELHDRLQEIGAKLVLETCQRIAQGTITPTKQDASETLSNAPKINATTCTIDWNASINHIYNHIRGLDPFPGAWTLLNNGGKPIHTKIYKTEKEYAEHQLRNGTLVREERTLKVAVKEGYLILKEIQLSGKKRMPVNHLLNGLALAENAHFG